ncbi:2077_t:CDS:2, partial [Diversispora eburnea]
MDEAIDILLCFLWLASGITNLYPTLADSKVNPFSCDQYQGEFQSWCEYSHISRYSGWSLAILHFLMAVITPLMLEKSGNFDDH